jgi:peptide methionine sulfoxide reductase MsrA
MPDGHVFGHISYVNLTRFKEKRTPDRETFNVFFTYTDPTDGQKKEKPVGTITED